MMIGRKNPKMAETAGGRTPETKVKVPGEAFDQDWRKGTKVVRDARLARMEMMNRGNVLKKQTRTKKIQPVVLFLLISALDLFRLSHIYQKRRSKVIFVERRKNLRYPWG